VKTYFKKHIFTLIEKILKAKQIEYYNNLRVQYQLHHHFKFNGARIIFYGEGEIKIGKRSYIGENSYIQSVLGESVEIGENCAISHNVRIYTLSYVADQNFNNPHKLTYQKSVKIGNGVWIGANVLINPGVKIGDNSVIGANSVVTKDIEPDTINGGVPCKLIRKKIV
jgi:maltose O-acetyltransferase